MPCNVIGKSCNDCRCELVQMHQMPYMDCSGLLVGCWWLADKQITTLSFTSCWAVGRKLCGHELMLQGWHCVHPVCQRLSICKAL
jgi:hypothetical protein